MCWIRQRRCRPARKKCVENRADWRDGFGYYSRRETCKYREEANEMKNASGNNRFLALTAIESEADEDVNAFRPYWRSWRLRWTWEPPRAPDQVERKVSRERCRRGTVKLAAANGSSIRVEGDARLELVRNARSAARGFWTQISKDRWRL